MFLRINCHFEVSANLEISVCVDDIYVHIFLKKFVKTLGEMFENAVTHCLHSGHFIDMTA